MYTDLVRTARLTIAARSPAAAPVSGRGSPAAGNRRAEGEPKGTRISCSVPSGPVRQLEVWSRELRVERRRILRPGHMDRAMWEI